MSDFNYYQGKLPENLFDNMVNDFFDNPIWYYESHNYANIDQYTNFNKFVLKGIIFDTQSSLQFFTDFQFSGPNIIHFFLITKKEMMTSDYQDINKLDLKIIKLEQVKFDLVNKKIKSKIDLQNISLHKILIEKKIPIKSKNKLIYLIDPINTFYFFKI
ncbi:MAG: hypothetical protein ACTSRP_13500 [Candidatus Helarchaeota archaeon]